MVNCMSPSLSARSGGNVNVLPLYFCSNVSLLAMMLNHPHILSTMVCSGLSFFPAW